MTKRDADSKTATTSAPKQKPASIPASQAEKTTPETGARFHFFLIDSGWNSAAARVIRDNIEMITRFQNNDPLFVLDQAQSTALMRRHPHLIGKDPILLARDLRARSPNGKTEYHGFHLNMGLVKDPVAAVEGLRKFLHFLAVHRQSADIESDVRQQLHREGLAGAIEVLRMGGEALVG
jgi:hypothetical protein